ncbi:MAG: tail fiber domain-containing protein [Candidatus Electrothrix sp. Rat3]|nr:tail fiber domain-containing protein [Candidatus Electrothrix rattekaaiensis]
MEKTQQPNRPNCSVIQPIAENTTLTYALQTNPDPLRAGCNKASLEFVVTNITDQNQAVTSIVFELPVGDGGLVPTVQGINTELSDTNNWKVSINPSSGIANITLTPQNGYAMPVNASVVLQLYDLQTVSSPGNTNITITEKIGTAQRANGDFQVSVFPSNFFFDGLVANITNGSQLTPVAQVSNGGVVTLTWNSTVADLANITIYWSDPNKDQQSASPTENSQWVSPELTFDTVFTVVATAHVENGQSMTLSRSVAVSVQNPDIYASFLKVNGGADINGTPGAYLQWNRCENGTCSGGTYILNQKGCHPGGFVIGEVDTKNNVTPQLTINSDGYVGINTSTPMETLDVDGNATFSGTLQIGAPTGPNNKGGLYVNSYAEITQQGAYLQWNRYENGVQYGKTYLLNQRGNGPGGFVIGEVDTNNNVTAQVNIDPNGYVGIGTATPTATLDVTGNATCSGTFTAGSISTNKGSINCGNIICSGALTVSGAAPRNIGHFGFLNEKNPTGQSRSDSTVLYSIIGSQCMTAVEFHATSDQRTKRIISTSDSSHDVETIKRFKVTDFVFIDKSIKGDRPQKKLIAQQIDEFFPQAVNKTNNVIPNVYALSHSTRYDKSTHQLTIKTKKPHEFSDGDTIRIVDDVSTRDVTILEVLDECTFAINSEKDIDKVFVYGKYVNDFLVIDYDSISALHISATQEILRRLESLENKYESIRQENSQLRESIKKTQCDSCTPGSGFNDIE